MRKPSLRCYIYLLLTMLFLAGCSVNAVSKQTESTDTGSEETTTEDIIGSSEEIDLGSETELPSDFETEEKYTASFVHGSYYSFEEGIDMASYVVEARCINIYVDAQYTYAVFEKLNNIKGEVKEETFIVRANRRATIYVEDLYIYTNDYVKTYCIGNDYVLVMDRYVSVYNDYDYYSILGGIYIPKDNISAAEMFGNGSLYVTAENKECLDAGYDDFINYIKELVKENPTGTGGNGCDYIRSDKLDDIVRETKTILKIKMGYHHAVGTSRDREECFCTVIEVLKGTLTKEEVTILIPVGIAVTDDEYLVMLYSRIEDSGYYTMSSKNSVYRWDDTEKVEKIIELIEQSE